MKWPTLAVGAAVVLLLVADFLAFHDLFEPHSIRDWVMLVASILAVAGVLGGSNAARRMVDRRA